MNKIAIFGQQLAVLYFGNGNDVRHRRGCQPDNRDQWNSYSKIIFSVELRPSNLTITLAPTFNVQWDFSSSLWMLPQLPVWMLPLFGLWNAELHNHCVRH